MNIGYSPEALDQFLHGYKGEWADAARKDQLEWPSTPRQDKHLIWPSKVFLYPSLALVEDVYLNVNSKRENYSNSEIKDANQNSINSFNQIDLTNDADLPPSLEMITNFGQLKVETKEVTSLSIAPSDINNNYRSGIKSPYIYEILNSSTAHDALRTLSLSCADDGERIARIHCYRPFFKKIDGLCNRIKLDLIHHDSVIPHVNAQGIVWAIKDLVFVCTRIINAWNITKGYVYDPSVGLNKVRSTLTPEFVPSFVEWQEATLSLYWDSEAEFLNVSYMIHGRGRHGKNEIVCIKYDTWDSEGVNLINQMKNCSTSTNINNKYWEQCGCIPCKSVISSKETHNALMELSVICSDYGEKVAQNYINRPFFKKVDSLCIRTKLELISGDGALSNLNSQGTVWAIKELIFASTRIINAWNITKGYVYGSSVSLNKVRLGLSSDFVPSFIAWQETTKKFVENLRSSFLRLDNLAQSESNNFKNESISKPIKVFKDHLQQLKSAEFFFRSLFCRNYFPDFIAKTPDFKDVRSIIKKCQSGSYGHINEVVHDVRFIMYQVKKYLMRNIEPNLDRAVSYFQADVDKILAHKSFQDYHFDHIEGRPNEILFLSH